jgi:hypothetical protein
MFPPALPDTLATRLQALLELLFPEPPLVDILTLTDFANRYPFTRLGRLAVAAIEQSQRVTRASGDYGQMGLSEFYAGLIHLHEGQFLGAAHFFAEARRYWMFAGRTTAVCLTHLAQGIAQQGAFQYELALARYGQAERCLRRLLADDLLGRNGEFVAACRTLLSECREELAQRLQAQAEGDLTEREAQRVLVRAKRASQEARTRAESSPAQPSPEPPPDTRPPADRPIVNLRSQPPPPDPAARPEEEAEREGETTAVFLPPPIPGHQNTQPHLVWYKADPVENFDAQTWLPGVTANAHILVDTRIDRYFYNPGDLVIVNSERVNGQIPVRPDEPSVAPIQDPIFLGEVEKPPPDDRDGPVGSDDPGSVRLSPDTEAPLFAEDIIGIVIGVWADFALRQRP